jgi:hypothetical protein
MVSLLKIHNAEVAEAEEQYCVAEVRGATRIDPAEYCENEATVQDDNGEWYCPLHDPDNEPDFDQRAEDAADWWLDEVGDVW